MYCSSTPGLSVFYDWLSFEFSGVSLETAANFFLFLNVAIIRREKLVTLIDWIDFYFFNILFSCFYEEKRFQ